MNDNLWINRPEWFKSWFNSAAYHSLYGHRSEEEAVHLVDNLVRAGIVRAPGRALDAGCGAGRHARALSRAGMTTEAFDLSEQSIEMARKSSADNPRFRVLDLRMLAQEEAWHGRFDLVTNFFTSLGYFSVVSEQQAVIEGFEKVMKADGLLLIDYLNVPHVMENLVSHETIERNGVSFNIHRRVHQGWIEKSIKFVWEGEEHHHVERVQALTLAKFQTLLAGNELLIDRLFGDYDLGPWSQHSPRCLMIVKKRKAPLSR